MCKSPAGLVLLPGKEPCRFFWYLPLLLENLHLFAQAAQLFFLFGSEPIALSSVDFGLVDPLTQRLGAETFRSRAIFATGYFSSQEWTSRMASSLNSGE